MEKKEAYRHNLPHFQQPGQAYFITWILKDAVPPKALFHYTQKLKILKSQIEFLKAEKREKQIIDELIFQYNLTRKKYMKVYDDMLAAESRNTPIDLSKPENVRIIKEALHFWENKKLKNYAYSIMPNHVHWVIGLKEKDTEEKPVYLQDILQSVKRHSARQINIQEGRSGTLWHKESFDTTIRDEKHLYNAIEYTLNNPVNAGLVRNREDWPGNGFFDW
ncbi:MAG: transposase [Mariniphaga sp.]|nr:transposase [Mariniphaga sp.]